MSKQPPKTSTREPIDLAAALAAARGPVEAPRMPHVPLREAIESSPWLHRAVPARLDVPSAELRGAAHWHRHADTRENARAMMRTVLAGTARENELEALARRYVIEIEAKRVLFWRSKRNARVDGASRVNLETTLDTGRGVLLSVCHLGPYFDLPTPIHRLGRATFAVAGPWFFEPPTANLWGRRLAHWRRKVASRKIEHLIPAPRSFAVLQALLEAGEVVHSFFDMPGPHQTDFLGKPVMLADGAARLAIGAGSLVLPARSRRVGRHSWADFAEPLDARDFRDADELHARLAAIHSELVLDTPEALEDPRRDGAWEAGATADAWISPRHRTTPTESALRASA
jgi:lauroyl/myristoyl acyltransferase